MSMIEGFFPEFASVPRDVVARPKWRLSGRLAWRITFFGKLVRTVEEEREHRDPEGARYSEKRWRDMRAGDLVDVEEARTDRELKRVLAEWKREPSFPSDATREAYDSLSEKQRLQLDNIASANGSDAAERTLASMVAQATHFTPITDAFGAAALAAQTPIAEPHEVEHLPGPADVSADASAFAKATADERAAA